MILAVLGAVPAAAAVPCEIKITETSCGITLAHGVTHFQVTEGAPWAPSRGLVVLIAGYAVPMVVWEHTVEPLARNGFTVLRFDFYGRGRSARPDVRYEPLLFAEQLKELVAKLGLPPRFHVVASSMGGIVTAAFATRYPNALDRVVL